MVKFVVEEPKFFISNLLASDIAKHIGLRHCFSSVDRVDFLRLFLAQATTKLNKVCTAVKKKGQIVKV